MTQQDLRLAIADKLVEVDDLIRSSGLPGMSLTLIARNINYRSMCLVVTDEPNADDQLNSLCNACAQAIDPEHIAPEFGDDA